MKIDVYSIMRNEIKILPYFLRHYESFADRIFVWEDGSNDGTREMLEAHPKVKVLPLYMDGADDVYYVRYLWPQYKDISRGHADWVICADADELVYHPNLVEKLKEFESKGIKKVLCAGYTMYSPVFPTTTGQIYEEIKMGWPDRWSQKEILFTPDLDMVWTPGRHGCAPIKEFPVARRTGVNTLHFRYLGPEYFLERNKKNCQSMRVKFKERQRYNLPDGTRGIPYVWYEENKSKVVNIVDSYEESNA